MPRRAHRRCKIQGPTCNGITHPGFDQCHKCLQDVIRPRMREEKEAMRRRKAKRLSEANRALISEVDLKEPQMRPEPVADPLTLSEAISGALIDKQLESVGQDGRLDKLTGMLTQKFIGNDLPLVRHPERAAQTAPPEEEPEPVATAPAPPEAPTNGRRHRQSRLSADQVDEILEAFKSDISTTEIQAAYGIGAQTLYTLVRRAGLPLRGQSRRLPPEETPVVKTSEPASPAQVETESPNGLVPGLTEWVVTYEVVKTETVTVAAKSFNDAALAVEARGITVTSVARKRA